MANSCHKGHKYPSHKASYEGYQYHTLTPHLVPSYQNIKVFKEFNLGFYFAYQDRVCKIIDAFHSVTFCTQALEETTWRCPLKIAKGNVTFQIQPPRYPWGTVR